MIFGWETLRVRGKNDNESKRGGSSKVRLGGNRS